MRQLRLLGTALLLVTFGLVGLATSAEAGDAFAVDDEYTVMQGSAPSLLGPDVTANDTGVAGVIFTNSQPLHGVVSSSMPGHDYTYAPLAGFSGDDTFTYTFLGTDSQLHTATVTIHVTPVGSSSHAVDDEYTVEADSLTTTLNPDVTANDTGISPISIFSNTPASHGTVNSSGPLTHNYGYTPDAGFSGDDSFTYTFMGIDGVLRTGTVTIHVTPGPGLPQAVDDEYTVFRDSGPNVLSPDVTANDVGIWPLSQFSNTPASHGTVTKGLLVGDHDFSYAPTLGFTGDDTFTYTFTGLDLMPRTATVTIHVVDLPTPKAVDDEYTVVEGSGANHLDPIVTANDVGVVPGYFAHSSASHGFVEAAMFSFDYTYTPNPGFSGDDSFTYTFIGTDGNFHEGTVTIHVTPLTVIAAPDEYTVVEGSGPNHLDPIVTANDVGVTQGLYQHSSASHGLVEAAMFSFDYTYTPDPGFSGDDSFTYTFLGIDGEFHEGTVTIHVTPVTVIAADDEYTVVENSAANHLEPSVTANDVGISSTPEFAHSSASHGSVPTPPGSSDFTYTPDPDFHGDDSFTYTFIGTDGVAHTAKVTIHVTPAPGPYASDDEFTVAQDSGTTVLSPDVTANDFGFSSALFTNTPAAYGIVTTTQGQENHDYAYKPEAGFYGDDSFTYTFYVGDDPHPRTATVTIHVIETVPAVTAKVDSGIVHEDFAPNPVTGNVLTNDSATSGTLSVSNPGTYILDHGTLVLNANGTYSYTLDNSNPAVGSLNDGDSVLEKFTYHASNGAGGSDSAELQIQIVGHTDATPVEFTVTGSQTFGGSPSFGYSSSVPGVTATGVTCTKVNPGSVTISSSLPVGSYTVAGCTGTVDAAGYAPTFTGGTFEVDPDPDAVTAVADAKSVEEDSAPNPVTGNVLTNDSATSGTLSVTNAGTVTLDHGTLVLQADGSYTYTLDNSDPAVNALNNGQTLTDSFTYNTSNGQGSTGSAALKITINGSTDAAPLPAKKVEVDTDSSATIGHTITVKVEKLAAGERYKVDIGGTEVKTGNADSKGKATFKVVVPLTLPAGQTLIRVVGQAANRTDSDRITIKHPGKLDIDLDHSTVKPGKTQTVEVSGFIPGEDVTFAYDGTDMTPSGAHADSKGEFKIKFPVGTTEGTHMVTFTGDFANRTATKTFKVKR